MSFLLILIWIIKKSFVYLYQILIDMIIVIIILILVRLIEFFYFMKNLIKVCTAYDWKYVNEHEELLPYMLEDKYYLKAKWSAYNFLFLNGPHPIFILLSFKILTLDNIYNKDNMEKIRKYEII